MGDQSLCDYMDCRIYRGTAVARFIPINPTDNSTTFVTLEVYLFNGLYKNEILTLTLNISELPDCEDNGEVSECISM